MTVVGGVALISLTVLLIWASSKIQWALGVGGVPPEPQVRWRQFKELGSATGCSIFFIPGVQSRGEEALLPLDRSPDSGAIAALRKWGKVITATYVREAVFIPRHVVEEIAYCVQVELCTGRQVVLIGSSFGGMLVMDVVRGLSKEERANVRVILVSTPYSTADLLAGGAGLGKVLRWTWADKWLTPLLWFFRLPAGKIPEASISKELDVAVVQAEGARRSRGFRVSGLIRQVGYMARWRGVNHGALPARMAYVQCLQDTVVRQPQAAWAWERTQGTVCFGLRVPHCSFLEQPRAWASQFTGILENWKEKDAME